MVSNGIWILVSWVEVLDLVASKHRLCGLLYYTVVLPRRLLPKSLTYEDLTLKQYMLKKFTSISSFFPFITKCYPGWWWLQFPAVNVWTVTPLKAHLFSQHTVSDQITFTIQSMKMWELFCHRPVDGGLPQQLIIQHRPSDKLVADAVLEAAVDLWTTPMGVEDLEHFHLSVPVHIQLRHFAVQSHQNTTGLLEGGYIAADQLVGDSFCERLWKERKIKIGTLIQLQHTLTGSQILIL